MKSLTTQSGEYKKVTAITMCLCFWEWSLEQGSGLILMHLCGFLDVVTGRWLESYRDLHMDILFKRLEQL